MSVIKKIRKTNSFRVGRNQKSLSLNVNFKNLLFSQRKFAKKPEANDDAVRESWCHKYQMEVIIFNLFRLYNAIYTYKLF